jgi:hypothetical protein
MKRIIETDEKAGFEALLGEQITLMCANYTYEGKLVGVNDTFLLLEDPGIVFETGAYDDPKWKDRQAFKCRQWRVQIAAVESWGQLK